MDVTYFIRSDSRHPRLDNLYRHADRIDTCVLWVLGGRFLEMIVENLPVQPVPVRFAHTNLNTQRQALWA